MNLITCKHVRLAASIAIALACGSRAAQAQTAAYNPITEKSEVVRRIRWSDGQSPDEAQGETPAARKPSGLKWSRPRFLRTRHSRLVQEDTSELPIPQDDGEYYGDGPSVTDGWRGGPQLGLPVYGPGDCGCETCGGGGDCGPCVGNCGNCCDVARDLSLCRDLSIFGGVHGFKSWTTSR